MPARFDIGTLRKPEKTPQGFLRVDGLLTRTGVFEYRKPDGGIRRELRRAEDVFDAAALASFAMAPVTDGHPSQMLTPENARQHARGHLGESVRRDGEFVHASMVITDATLIAKMEEGTRALSCGYNCDLLNTPGELDGERYDAIQTNIRGNHVAVLSAGRAGAECRVRMDADDAAMVDTKANGGDAPPRKDRSMDEIKELQMKLAKAEARADVAEASLVKLTARGDAAEAELAKERTARKDAADAMPAQIRARVALEKTAGDVLGTVKLDGLSDREIKVLVVEKVGETKLDAKNAGNDVYVDARFDGVLETLARKSGDPIAKARAAGEKVARSDADNERKDGAVTYATAVRDLWKQPIPGAAVKE